LSYNWTASTAALANCVNILVSFVGHESSEMPHRGPSNASFPLTTA